MRYSLIAIFFICCTWHFSAKAEEIKAISCAEIQIKNYGTAWELFKSRATAEPEKALAETLDALHQKNAARLRTLSYPADKKTFDEQSFAYFKQLETIAPTQVKAYYRFENLGVFYIQFKWNGGTAIVDFPFIINGSDSPKFLIDRMPYVNGPIYRRLGNWYGSDKKETPYVCQNN